MKIKEVEQRTGVGRSNIHYYEKEGFLSPIRNRENNYREYTEEDVKRIEKIKVLRMIGVSPADVKLLMQEEITLESVMKKRLLELELEVKEAKNLQKVCENIISSNMEIEELDENVLTGSQEEWMVRLKEVLEIDLVKKIITRKQMNFQMMLFLAYGYMLNAVVAFTVGDFFLTYTRVKDPSELDLQRPVAFTGGAIGYILVPSIALIIMMILAIICSVAIYCEASVKAHVLIFHTSAFITTPLFIELSRMYSDLRGAKELGHRVLTQFSGKQIAIFWIMIIVYVIVLYLISVKWEQVFLKRRFIFLVGGVATIIFALLAYTSTGNLKIPFVMFGFMTLFIGMSWASAVRKREIYNQYYAVISATKIMNVIGTLHSKRGPAKGSLYGI